MQATIQTDRQVLKLKSKLSFKHDGDASMKCKFFSTNHKTTISIIKYNHLTTQFSIHNVMVIGQGNEVIKIMCKIRKLWHKNIISYLPGSLNLRT